MAGKRKEKEETKEFLQEVTNIVAGKQAGKIIDFLDAKKYVNEFLIAKKMDITINRTRNILYKLSNYGLVSSTRKKDKKKGWYTYFWKIELLKFLEFLQNELLKGIERKDHQIKNRETKDFYFCERCKIEFNGENALYHDFVCNECGSVLSLKNNDKVLKELKKERDKMQKELDKLSKAIDAVRQGEKAKLLKEPKGRGMRASQKKTSKSATKKSKKKKKVMKKKKISKKKKDKKIEDRKKRVSK